MVMGNHSKDWYVRVLVKKIFADMQKKYGKISVEDCRSLRNEFHL